MDWDQLATISQLVTGAATLAVAVFLANQLRLQRKDSDRAHNDSERDFAFSNENRQQNLFQGVYVDSEAWDLQWKGLSDYESLTPKEEFRFRIIQQMIYLWSWNAWRLKRDGEDIARFRFQWVQLLEQPGARRFHEEWGRPLLARDASMLLFVEGVYEEMENQAA
tara:strand:- start:90 stop:584 length:495 start_codon:yes stop_codon:yes gene_type:complete